MSLSQRKGLIKGWIMRAVDCASSVEILNCSLKCVLRELCSLHYPVKLFREVFHDLSRRYLILSDADRLSSTWEQQIGSEDWHLFQCTIVQTLFPLWKWFFTRLYRGDINTMSQPWKLGIQVILGFLVFTCSISTRQKLDIRGENINFAYIKNDRTMSAKFGKILTIDPC